MYMRKIFCVLLILNAVLGHAASSLTLRDGISLSFSAPSVSFSTATGYMRIEKGPLRVGNLGENTLMHSLLDAHSYSFEGIKIRSAQSVKGISLSFEEISWFILSSPRLIAGFSMNAGGFLFGFAHAEEDRRGDDLFLSHSERYGYEADVLHAGYMNDNLLFRVKFSHSASVSSDFLVTAGASFKGLSFVCTGGREANLLGRSTIRQSWVLSLKSSFLFFTLSTCYLNDPVRAGTFREIECLTQAGISFSAFRLSMRQKAFFSSGGEWKSSVEYTLEAGPVTLSCSSSEGVSLSYTDGRLGFFVSRNCFGVKYSVEYRNVRMSFQAESSGAVHTSVSLELP